VELHLDDRTALILLSDHRQKLLYRKDVENIVSISPSGLIKEELYDLMGDPDERMGFQWQSSISR
jgi:hypothetical protein